MTYNVLMGTLNPTHSPTHCLSLSEISQKTCWWSLMKFFLEAWLYIQFCVTVTSKNWLDFSETPFTWFCYSLSRGHWFKLWTPHFTLCPWQQSHAATIVKYFASGDPLCLLNVHRIFRPILEYCTCIWSAHFKSLVELTASIQNNCSWNESKAWSRLAP